MSCFGGDLEEDRGDFGGGIAETIVKKRSIHIQPLSLKMSAITYSRFSIYPGCSLDL